MAKVASGSRLAKYSSLIIYILLFLIITASILGYNFYTSTKLAKETTAINIASRQSIIAQQLAKNVMNIDLLTEDLNKQPVIEPIAEEGSDTASTADIQTNTKKPAKNQTLTPEVIEAIERLKKSRNLFETTLSAFEKGGTTLGLQNTKVSLNKVTDNDAVVSVKHARELWEPYKRLIDAFIASSENNKINKETIRYAVDYARIFNSYLFFETNDLTKALERKAQRQTELLKLVQTVGIVAAFLLFFLIMFGALRQLLNTDKELDNARQETNDILETVNSGLFLLDKDLKIGNQHSAALENILLTQNISGNNLNTLLKSFVSKEDIETTGDFINQLYNNNVHEELINDLNPLNKIQVFLRDGEQKVKRFLDFGFSRIYKDDEKEEISHILVSVNDITEAVTLEEKLAEEREKSDEQIQMISTILHADIRSVRDFVKSTKRSTNKINDILKDSKKGTNVLKEKLESMFREAHGVKGESSALNLKTLTNKLIDFEEHIKELQAKSELSGNDFLPLTVRLDGIIEVIHTIEMLSKRIGVVDVHALEDKQKSMSSPNMVPVKDIEYANTANIHDSIEQTAIRDNALADEQSGFMNNNNFTDTNPADVINTTTQTTLNQLDDAFLDDNSSTDKTDNHVELSRPYQYQFYEDFVGHIAKREQKLVTMDLKGVELLNNQTEQHIGMKEIALQLIRNAVTHGVEKPGERVAAGKSEQSVIKLHFEETPEELHLVVEDDGHGIDYDSIRNKAIASGNFDAAEVSQWEKRKLLALIFSSGFSTADQVSEDAGQGVGLNLVKSRIQELHGKIKIDTESGRFTKFTVSCTR